MGTITKKGRFVILFAAACAPVLSCTGGAPREPLVGGQERPAVGGYGAPVVIGSIKNPNVNESSGIAASRCREGVFWTHNDSGDANLLFSFNGEGTDLGTFIVKDAENKDWEDIASYRDRTGQCFILIADIGNNGMGRAEFKVYKVPEPVVGPANGEGGVPKTTAPAEAIRFTYGDERYDAESLLVHPLTGDIYVVTKQLSGGASVFKVGNADDAGRRIAAAKVGEIAAPTLPAGLFTGGDVSPDGMRVMVTDYFFGYELVLPDPRLPFDEIWEQPLKKVDLGTRKQGESVCYTTDGKNIVAGSERAGSPLVSVSLPK